MPKPSWENLDVFLQDNSLGGFAIHVVIETQGSRKTVIGIFDEPYLNAQLGEYDIDDAQPRFLCKAVDCIGIKRGDTLILPDSRTFYIMTYPQHDGTGMCTLKMENQK